MTQQEKITVYTFKIVYMIFVCIFLLCFSSVDHSPKPKFDSTSERVVVTEGDQAILPCSVEFLGQQSVSIYKTHILINIHLPVLILYTILLLKRCRSYDTHMFN